MCFPSKSQGSAQTQRPKTFADKIKENTVQGVDLANLVKAPRQIALGSSLKLPEPKGVSVDLTRKL